MCFLKHKVPGTETSSNPFANAAAFNEVKEFVPPTDTPAMPDESSQAGILAMLKSLGYEAEVDPENRTIFIKKFEDCECCHGLVNSCGGEFCQNLGLCHCISAALHDDNESDD